MISDARSPLVPRHALRSPDEPVRRGPLVLVVGYDGTDASRVALTSAAQMARAAVHERGRGAHVEVVYVAHLPVTAALSADAVIAVHRGFVETTTQLRREAGTVLGDVGGGAWHFQRRDGAVAHELLATAGELEARHRDDDALVALVVGTPSHRAHRLVGGVPDALLHRTALPVVVV